MSRSSMKPLRALLTLAACAGVCAAQATPALQETPPGLSVLKLKWERRIDISPNAQRPTPVRNLPPSDPDAMNNPGGLTTTSRGPVRPYIYEYSVEIRNDGAKRINWLRWHYVLREPGTRRELGRHEFGSAEKIDPGKTKTLRGRTRTAPSQAGDGEPAKGRKVAPEERVELRCVAYEDGTLWRRPSAHESECAQAQVRGKPR